MSSAEVTRDGLEGVRPGREARVWSHDRDKDRARSYDHPGGSYYGRPIINPPVWEERDIAGYLFTGGLAGASSILAAGADLTGRSTLARTGKLCAAGALGLSLVALVHDLGRPARFLNMLRVFKPTSPMNVGAWLLGVYGPLNAAAAASDVLDLAPAAGKVASFGAGVLGAGVATYTAALIADTAVPAWREGRQELPFLFAASAASAAGGFGVLSTPEREAGPARQMALLGALGELVAEHLLQRRLGMVAETLHEGKAGRRLKAAKTLSAAGAVAVSAPVPGGWVVRRLGGAALLAGSLLTRLGIFEAGMASSRDPKYTVAPQRERLAAKHARAEAGADEHDG